MNDFRTALELIAQDDDLVEASGGAWAKQAYERRRDIARAALTASASDEGLLKRIQEELRGIAESSPESRGRVGIIMALLRTPLSTSVPDEGPVRVTPGKGYGASANKKAPTIPHEPRGSVPESVDPDAEAEAEFLKPIKPSGLE